MGYNARRYETILQEFEKGKKLATHILGISAYYHDSAAALITDGKIIAAAQEERFTRIKHDPNFPKNAVGYCLNQAAIELKDVDFITFYDKPLIKFERLLETYLSYAPKGLKSFLAAIPVWTKEKLFIKDTLKTEFSKLADIPKNALPKLMFTRHHQSHAASAFFLRLLNMLQSYAWTVWENGRQPQYGREKTIGSSPNGRSVFHILLDFYIQH